MRLVLDHDRCGLLHGAAEDLELAPGSIDALVTDPPSGTGFMGKTWDTDKGGRDAWIAWLAGVLRRAYAALKPGAYALVWALPRTSHWTACAIEDAGFEIRDVVMHCFGSGFPKSLDISKAIDARDAGDERRRRALEFTAWMRSTGITTERINELTETRMGSHYLTDKEQPAIAVADLFDRLRPHLPPVPDAIEDLVRERTVESENLKRREVIGHDVGPGRPGFAGVALDSDTDQRGGITREIDITAPYTSAALQWQGWGTALKPAAEHWILARKPLEGTYAENVLRYGTGAINIDGCRIGTDEDTRRASSGGDNGLCGSSTNPKRARTADEKPQPAGRWPAHLVLSHSDDCEDTCVDGCPVRMLEDQCEGASRFYYIAKGSRREKDEGLEHLPIKSGGEATDRVDGSAGLNNPRAGAGRNGGARNFHPTVKSIALMRWLVRLITPPGGTVLDLFAGSGTTGVAALAEGASFIGVELTDEYIPIAQGRLEHALRQHADAVRAA